MKHHNTNTPAAIAAAIDETTRALNFLFKTARKQNLTPKAEIILIGYEDNPVLKVNLYQEITAPAADKSARGGDSLQKARNSAAETTTGKGLNWDDWQLHIELQDCSTEIRYFSTEPQLRDILFKNLDLTEVESMRVEFNHLHEEVEPQAPPPWVETVFNEARIQKTMQAKHNATFTNARAVRANYRAKLAKLHYEETLKSQEAGE